MTVTRDDISPSASSTSVGDELVRMMETSDVGITASEGGQRQEENGVIVFL